MSNVVLPVTLTAGSNENVNDLNSNLNALVAAINGNLDETNVPNLAAAFTTWKTVLWGGATFPASGAGTFVMPGGPTANAAGSFGGLGAASTAAWAFYLDPADWAANARTTRLRIRWVLVTNAVAPATTFTPGVYPVATFGGAAGVNPAVATLGTVVTGSTAAYATPGASNGGAVSLSTEFNAPAAGHYVFGLVIAGTMAASSGVTITGHLQMRQV